MLTNTPIVAWLLQGDVSIQYQAHRDLLGINKPNLRKKIALEGWGDRLLSKRHPDGHWGNGFYQPKWTCTHYTLLDLKNLGIVPDNKLIKKSLAYIFENLKAADGGLYGIGVNKQSDVCVNGMVLNYASYFQIKEENLESLVDFLLANRMSDGGFNCQSNRKGASHSSLHSTLSVLEGILEYDRNGYGYRRNELMKVKSSSEEFMLTHQLFRSHRTGKIIKPDFLKFYYPCRWFYDVLRALDYFQLAKTKYDDRMQEALELIKSKKDHKGRWKITADHPGKVHFTMEESGNPSRWNTLRALRSLKFYA